MEAIQTVGLTKYYGKARGIVGLDLQVEQGEYFGFIGPNGAGKSTTIRTLLGLISPSSGSAQVLGLDVRKDKEAILARVGYLPSEAAFWSGMKVREVLRLSAELRKADCAAEAERLCQRLQLDQTRKVDELSFGNRKKVAIVCALQSCPELLILDEPTGGLDPLMQHEFFDILRERNEAGATIFLSSHVLSEIQRNCRRAAVIREGRVIACDRVEALAKTNAKRITVRGRIDLEGLEDVRDLTVRENGLSFLYGGEIKPLLRRLAEGEVEDFSAAEPDLEEIFLHYYEKGGEEA
ncbi:MAG: ABC transporter ATP-binding protein [Oscillospiraceae bacterium]|nr:ABC transporter ATP-binding protein [Oscillospiraceae bacterium]